MKCDLKNNQNTRLVKGIYSKLVPKNFTLKHSTDGLALLAKSQAHMDFSSGPDQ